MRPGARPVVALVCDHIQLHRHAAHAVFDGYVRAVAEVSQALPLLLPALGPALDVAALLDSVDALLLTGSPSNVAPPRYGAPLRADDWLDEQRDATTLAHIPPLVQQGLPLLGVCRGLQEINVAYGGTPHPEVHERPGRLDHRIADMQRPVPEWYGDSHPVRVLPGGRLAALLGEGEVVVNSLHEQGIERLGPGLRAEAQAADGLVEALSVEGAPALALAVQWHPEMRVADQAAARALFVALGDAARARHAQRRGATA